MFKRHLRNVLKEIGHKRPAILADIFQYDYKNKSFFMMLLLNAVCVESKIQINFVVAVISTPKNTFEG